MTININPPSRGFFFFLEPLYKVVKMNTIPYTPYKIHRLARKYLLTPSQVEELYIRTLDDYQLLERACQLLANGEDMEEVSLMIIKERK